MATQKPDLTRVWANSAPPGNVVDPDTTTPGKVAVGWQAEVPPFEHFNFLQKWFTEGLAHFNEQGVGVWDTDTTYPIGGLAKGSDGEIYAAVIEQYGNDPVSDNGSNWELFGKTIFIKRSGLTYFSDYSQDRNGLVQAINDSNNNNTQLVIPFNTNATIDTSIGPVIVPSGGIDILLYGELIAKHDAAPTTLSEEQDRFLFYAEDVDAEIRVSGSGRGRFNGNKGGTFNPYTGFLKTEGCPNVECTGVNFRDVDNSLGTIHANSHSVGRDVVMTVRFDRNEYRRCAMGSISKGAVNGLSMQQNKLYDMDLSNANTGVPRFGGTAFLGRGLRFTGFTVGGSTVADGQIEGVNISNNFVRHATYCIECWNQDATEGRNPDESTQFVLNGNSVRGLFGIGTNSNGVVSVAGNVVRYSKFDAAAMLLYAGTSYLTDTSVAGGNSAGAGLELRPGRGIATGNTVDLEYDPTEVNDLTAASFGISVGTSSKNVSCEFDVVGGNVDRCKTGIDISDCQNSNISAVTIKRCDRPVDSRIGTNSFGYSGNSLTGCKIFGLPKTDSNQVLVSLMGDWDVENNTLNGNASDIQNTPLLRLDDDTATVSVKKNTFRNFEGVAVQDDAARTTYDGNEYDAGAAPASVSTAIRIIRRDNKVVRIIEETLARGRFAVEWDNSNGATIGESYDAKTFYLPDDVTAPNRGVGGNTAYIVDMPAFYGYRDAAPATGTKWPQGGYFRRKNVSAGGTAEFTCVASGTPGTWRDSNSIAV